MPSLTSALLGDVAALLGAVGALLGLGLVMAFSPTTFGIEIGALERSRRTARAQVLIVAGAVALAATLLATVFLLIHPNAVGALWAEEGQRLIALRWVDAAAGALLIAVGGYQWWRARRPRRPKRSLDHLDRPRVLFSVVLAESLVSTTGPATMFLVVRTITTTEPLVWPIAYLVFLIGLTAPYVWLAVAFTRMPSASRWLSYALVAAGRHDLRRPIAAVLLLAGLALLTWAVIEMVSAGQTITA